MATSSLPILHFNDVYRVLQRSKQGTISADQFAAKIAKIRTEKWGEPSRALAFLQQKQQQDQQPTDAASPSSSRPLHGLTLFSGDAFNPSIESSVTRGQHMVEVLSSMSLDCSLVGNHDLDFGFSHLTNLMRQTNFPWTFSNIADVGHTDPQRGQEEAPQPGDKQVEGTLPFWTCEVDTASSNGGKDKIRVGCIGLVEKDWIATVPTFPPNFRYRSMVDTAVKLSKTLRDPSGSQRCDLIIALSHCRLPNDIDLANDVGAVLDAPEDRHGVDLILGGHDHTYYVGKGVKSYTGQDWETSLPGKEKDQACLLVKSGTDFHDLSEIELQVSEPKEGVVRRRRIVSAKVTRHVTTPDDPSLPELKEHIDELMKRVDQATGEPVAFSLTPLDCHMDVVRTQESAVGSFVADILLHSYDSSLRERDERGELDERRPSEQREVDLALICGGSLRGDTSFGPGAISVRDILTIMPFEDAIIVRLLKGKDILDALEHGFGSYPSQEGRFPQVAGCSIVWDSSKPAGSRLVEVRLLRDVHLFDEDGARRHVETDDTSHRSTPTSSTPPAADGDAPGSNSGEGSETYAFKRLREGGYAIEVTKPRIQKGELLDPERIYRVVTREYMAEGHDGYEALTRACGEDLVDHENGSLMSTQVRKYLLGASLIWRLKTLRDHTDDAGRGYVGHFDTLSTKTRKAIERARALGQGGKANIGVSDKSAKQGDEQTLDVPASLSKLTKPSPLQVTSAGAESAMAVMGTPQRSSGGDGGDVFGRRVVIDASPGSFRDAMHAGSSEHHSWHDAASQHFQTSGFLKGTGAPQSARFSGAAAAPTTAAQSSTHKEPSSAPARVADGAADVVLGDETSSSIGGDESQDGAEDSPSARYAPMMTSSTFSAGSDDGAMDRSSYFTSHAVRKHVEVSAEDGELLRSAEGSLAVIAPMRDGRIIDVARGK